MERKDTHMCKKFEMITKKLDLHTSKPRTVWKHSKLYFLTRAFLQYVQCPLEREKMITSFKILIKFDLCTFLVPAVIYVLHYVILIVIVLFSRSLGPDA